ncbi:MAG TPA: type IV pilus modification protein PilV [Burkholderiales bacterium]|nr:type IV pilus modification protein PilV [Burkholderiales bacterium]
MLTSARRQRGVTMLEVLIAIFILTLGLLGSAGIQSQMQMAEVEAYQRAQAIVILRDMVDRVNANRKNAASYVTGSPLGTAAADCTALTTVAAKDLCEWNNALYGTAETKGGQTLGAMNTARGCITNPVTTMPREVVVAVAWQGVRPTLAPAATGCGNDGTTYGSDDRLRRALIARIVIGCLQNDPTTGACVTP